MPHKGQRVLMWLLAVMGGGTVSKRDEGWRRKARQAGVEGGNGGGVQAANASFR